MFSELIHPYTPSGKILFIFFKVVLSGLIATNSFASGFVEYRDSSDSYKSLKKISLQDNETHKIDLSHIGWKNCEISNSGKIENRIIQASCYSKDTSISFQCYGEEEIEVMMHGSVEVKRNESRGAKALSIKLICTQRNK